MIVGSKKVTGYFFDKILKSSLSPFLPVPLSSNERALNLQWERTLQPGETHKIELAIGMAKIDPATGIPRP